MEQLVSSENDRFVVLPKELFHYKPNARWGESYEYVAKILYPINLNKIARAITPLL